MAIDVESEREEITKFDPEEKEYCDKLLNEIKQLQADLDKMSEIAQAAICNVLSRTEWGKKLKAELDKSEVLQSFYIEGLEKDVELIKKLQMELDQYRWIPVSEGLPKQKKDSFKSEDVYVTDWKRVWVAAYNFSAYYWQCPSSDITHWKPIFLPEKT